MSKFSDHISLYADWLRQEVERHPDGKAYFISVTFDRYLDRYSADRRRPSGRSGPSRTDVAAGLTAKMSASDAAHEQIKAVHRWYQRVLSELLGGSYHRHRALQPRGLGFLDQPVMKKAVEVSSGTLPGDVFPNAHFVLVLGREPCPTKPTNLRDEFERHWQSGRWNSDWKRLQPEGDLHIRFVDDEFAAIDYAAKSAKRTDLFREHQILFPF
ncbi:hypothetical protein IZ6_28930 [Terrihabitans soli]|uniref:Uncharacterized protein n=1 Tax=Terrihabitans soli TaxID=708113 RepID=A0A6S6QZP8_9HYPH|nr:hypothetical protein [Terrihabitans soli]BCJ92158.1 hypothetical protein IZ6_28930 [Terrihabitans soli]